MERDEGKEQDYGDVCCEEARQRRGSVEGREGEGGEGRGVRYSEAIPGACLL